MGRHRHDDDLAIFLQRLVVPFLALTALVFKAVADYLSFLISCNEGGVLSPLHRRGLLRPHDWLPGSVTSFVRVELLDHGSFIPFLRLACIWHHQWCHLQSFECLWCHQLGFLRELDLVVVLWLKVDLGDHFVCALRLVIVVVWTLGLPRFRRLELVLTHHELLVRVPLLERRVWRINLLVVALVGCARHGKAWLQEISRGCESV